MAFVALAAVLPTLVHGRSLDAIGYGVALGIVGLSLVPLVGYAGQLSLAPLAFAGIGAVVMHRWGADGNPLALLAVAGVCAAIGALVALPALRLKGLYLALLTFAFALFCEKAVFTRVDGFSSGSAAYERLHLGSWSSAGDRANLVTMAIVFALLAVVITALRRGRFGRRLQAMKDSPAACATLGLRVTVVKLEVFALSAAIAGIGGALLAGWRGRAGIEQFSLLQGALPGLPLVLMVVVGGVTAAAGALLGAVLLAFMPLVGESVPAVRDLMVVLPGLAGVALAANPDGAIAQTVAQVGRTLERRAAGRRGAGGGPVPLGARVREALLPRTSLVPEAAVAQGGLSSADVAALDAELGLDWGRCRVDPRDP